ncbi:UNVERIFIED_CONTAM: BEACH domain-containing protein B [Sesamum calycinum]|uniref:BEACH domain-containing protein B n=1 Tax=Sesamum calycinum TaxID=2727403 RepID=A0AAW2J4V8_9LAMI
MDDDCRRRPSKKGRPSPSPSTLNLGAASLSPKRALGDGDASPTENLGRTILGDDDGDGAPRFPVWATATPPCPSVVVVGGGMNIVKGVADLIWRSSGQSGEYGSVPQSGRFSPPNPTICFSEVRGLKALLEKYVTAVDEVEKRKLFHIFLKQFLTIFQNWKPFNLGQTPEETPTLSPVEYYQNIGDVVVGCSYGHPTEVILILTEEVSRITRLLTNNQVGITTSINITSESWMALDALAVVTLSIHNCKVFGYHGGIQKLTALMKAAVVQLKTITSALPADESLLNTMVESAGTLQKILVHVVSVICNFIDFHSSIEENVQDKSTKTKSSVARSGEILINPCTAVKSPVSETILSWHQKTVVSVMEAGGLNWLLDLDHDVCMDPCSYTVSLRVGDRVTFLRDIAFDQEIDYEEQWADMFLQHLTLRALKSALADNPRGQNHFRSIGGLEVLLDGLGVPSIDSLIASDSSSYDERNKSPLLGIFNLHVLSLEFLFENGRVQKFANSFCSVAFMLQEYKQRKDEFGAGKKNASEICKEDVSSPFLSDPSYLQHWKDYVARLSAALCYFFVEAKDTKSCLIQSTISRNVILVSAAYAELSVKWFTRVLLTVFPCIKACSDQNEIPSHLRIFAYTMQQCVLFAFKKVLLSSPSLVDVFRSEGVWDFIFSESFFYFGLAPTEFSGENFRSNEAPLMDDEGYSGSISSVDQVNLYDVDILQVEPECTILLDALEQSACNPELANVLAKGLLHILQLSAEKTVSSFKTLAAIPRLLKVACIQVQESKGPGTTTAFAETITDGVASCQSHEISYSPEVTQSWAKCMQTFMELFAEYFSVSDDTKLSILSSSMCINYSPITEEDKKAKVFLCSKYLETFTHVKERVKNFADLSVELLIGMRDMLLRDPVYYQALFREGECFLHVLSLLNGNLDAENGEKLVLNVIQTLTFLLSQNDASKAAFRALVGKGYQTLRSLLLDFCQWQPSEALLSTLLDMLVDGKFDLDVNSVIKNEDVILLYLSVLQKSSDSLQHHGLNMFLHLLRDSLSNQASCVRAGMLDFLLNWFSQDNSETIVWKISQLIQVIGGHSISGKDIRKIFALLRSENTGLQQRSSSLLLTSMLTMLNEKGPTAFFDLNGIDSGIVIKTPVPWPVYKGFSFTCWLRVENFPRNGPMGLFSFLMENGRGCYAVLAEDKLIYESINQKRQCVSMNLNLVRKKWHFFCLVHSVGRAFSGGSQLRCYLDGILVSSEKCRYAKVNDPLTSCTIGTKLDLPLYKDENVNHSIKNSYPFLGQIGPTYLFSDAISSELVQGIYSLGPSYMYYFLDNEISVYVDNFSSGGASDAKDGLASKIIFGLNAQASDGRTLFNVSPIVDQTLDKKRFEATSDIYEHEASDQAGGTLLTPIKKGHLTAETIKLIASILDDNLANQQQMLLLSGFSILGFLLQSVPAKQLNLETLSALKHLFSVVSNGGLSELLVTDAIACILLNPHIWVHAIYRVQRELYMFLLQQLDNDPRLLKCLCRLPRVLDIIRQFYQDNEETKRAVRSKSIVHVTTDGIVGEKLDRQEIHKIRLLLLSLGEMSLREHTAASDIKALLAFCETCQDMACIEDILNMMIRAVSHKQLLASFLEQLHVIGGCHIFVNLLSRTLRLSFLIFSAQNSLTVGLVHWLFGDLDLVQGILSQLDCLDYSSLEDFFVGLPAEKRGSKFFNISVGRSKSLSEVHKKISLDMQRFSP